MAKGGGNHEIPGQNIPRSRAGDAGWGFNEASGTTGAYWDIPYLGRNNTWIIGKQSSPHSAEAPFLTPHEAWSIDHKLDDGKPGTGNVIAHPQHMCQLGS